MSTSPSDPALPAAAWRRWIVLTLLPTVVVGAAVAIANARIDIYGLFRDTHGRRLPIYDSERRGKFLLNTRYVPENFDAILIGSSVTSNWNTSAIHTFRTYNESTDGGNITEERVLVERRLASPGLRAAICVIHPYLTDTHGLNTDELNPIEVWGALGSTSLFRTYREKRAVDRGRDPLPWDADGTEFRPDIQGLRPLNPVLTRIMKSEGEIHVDEPALAEYAAMVRALRRQGVKLVAVVPPTMEDLRAPRGEALARYVRRVLAVFDPPADLVVDFDAPAHEAFRRDATNYRDGVHLSSRGSAEVMRRLDRRIAEWAGGAPGAP